MNWRHNANWHYDSAAKNPKPKWESKALQSQSTKSSQPWNIRICLKNSMGSMSVVFFFFLFFYVSLKKNNFIIKNKYIFSVENLEKHKTELEQTISIFLIF